MDQSYSESAMAMEDTEVSIIPRQDFITLIHTNREVASQFIKMLSDNLNEQEEKLLHLAYNNSEVIYISREDLANMVGTAPESVIRTLSDFKEDKIIDIVSSKIYIKDKDRLDRIVKGLRFA